MESQMTLYVMAAAIFVIAILYSSVGHGGASGYIAVMALCSLAPETIKPTALMLNIVVSTIAVVLYSRAGHFKWSLFWPFAVTSIPASFVGGAVHLPSHLLKAMLGIALLFAAVRLLIADSGECGPVRELRRPAAMCAGAVMGVISGMTGIGGGIFLSPLILFLGWGRQKETAAVAALFILVNSSAGLAGHAASLASIPPYAGLLVLTALSGGLVGAYAGSTRMPVLAIARTLATVLSVAGIKLIAT